jgi:hypothetical protein
VVDGGVEAVAGVARAGEPWLGVVAKLGRLAERSMQRALVEENLSVGQYMALSHIARHPGINRSGLGGGLRVSPQSSG